MPLCANCGKEVQPYASNCPTCGASIRQTSQTGGTPSFQGMNLPPEIQMEKLMKRLTRLTWVSAITAAFLLITILIIYLVP
jgi:uncharacterized membrane protein YvbJ